MLRIEHYSKTYPGGKKAVDDLTLHVRPGEIFGFIGHNGAGKTTTLRACAGVLDFTQGTIIIDGREGERWGQRPQRPAREVRKATERPDRFAA